MSMSDLVSGGAGCGPSNPLQNIGKRFGQDRGAQQDTFASSPYAQQQASSFRSHNGATSSSQQQQQQQPAFFNAPSQHAPFAPQSNLHDAFDVSQLRGNLPSGSRTPMQSHHQHRPAQAPSMPDFEASFRPAFSRNATIQAAPRAAPSGWATDFLSAEASQQSTAQAQRPQQMHVDQHHAHAIHPNVIPTGLRMGMMPHTPANMHFSPSPMYDHAPQQHQQHTQSMQSTAAPQLDNARWAEAFTAFESSSKPAEVISQAVPELKPAEKLDYNDPQERDELARTAGRLVSSVEHDQSSKFQKSNFLDLMRKIRDKQAGIQGDNIVENADMSASTLDNGKGKARDLGSSLQQNKPQSQQEAYSWANQMAASGGLSQLPPGVQKSLATNHALQSDVPASVRTQQQLQNQQAINDLWAEEDARSEAIERQAMQESAQAFIGDGGNITDRMREDDADAQEFERYQRLGANIPHASTFNRRWEEDMNRPVDQMEDDELDFVGRRWEGTKGRGYPGAQTAEWDKLQSDWDNFEVTSAGIRPVTLPQRSASAATTSMQAAPTYRFLSDNPYIASTRHHAHHAGGLPAGLESVLEKEAAVQQDPQDASAWYDLGVKQQENEREVQAIAALRKALDLDPNLKDAWLALAVSYTNENDRTAAYEAIERWIESSDKYRDVLQRVNAELAAAAADSTAAQRNRSDSASSHSTSASVIEKHSRLTNLLIAMVRSGGERGEIDADVQVALGVIFNSSEDYDKAVDCFSTALSVRPQDWLLYNRLGATLSNSGRSAEAIQYYHHALNLQPEFVRCHFNLSISCLNLKMYQDAAEHMYTALTLQQAEAEQLGMVNGGTTNDKGSATSGSLWETFRVALELLNRSDLAAKCSRRDINAFDLSDFVAPASAGVTGSGEVGYGY